MNWFLSFTKQQDNSTLRTNQINLNDTLHSIYPNRTIPEL